MHGCQRPPEAMGCGTSKSSSAAANVAGHVQSFHDEEPAVASGASEGAVNSGRKIDSRRGSAATSNRGRNSTNIQLSSEARLEAAITTFLASDNFEPGVGALLLKQACLAADFESIDRLRRGGCTDTMDPHQRGVLHFVCMSGSSGAAECVASLLSHDRVSTSGIDSVDEYGASPLHVAAANGAVAVAAILLRTGARAESVDKKGCSPLHWLAGVSLQRPAYSEIAERPRNVPKMKRLAQALTKEGADIDGTNGVGETPLSIAVRASSADAIRALTGAGANVFHANGSGMTPVDILLELVLTGVDQGHSDGDIDAAFCALMDAGAEIPETANVLAVWQKAEGMPGVRDKLTGAALCEAARAGDVASLNALLSGGASVDVQGLHGEMPLTAAITGPNPEMCVKVLLDAGCDIASSDDAEGNTPLHEACRALSLDMVNLLLEAVKERGDASTLVNLRNHDGYTPILVTAAAASAGCLGAFDDAIDGDFDLDPAKEIIRALAEAGGDTKIVGNDKKTALSLFLDAQSEELALLCVSHGEDGSPEDGMTPPLVSAARLGFLDLVRALISKGADIAATGPDGRTAMHAAARAGAVEMVRVLLEQGADIEARDANETTALLHALAVNKETTVPTVQALLSGGADVNRTGRDDVSPLHFAAKANHLEALHALLEAGANANARMSAKAPGDGAGATPLVVAAESSGVEAVAALLEKGADRSIVSMGKQGTATALWTAVRRGDAEIVAALMLVGDGADNASALVHAAFRGDADTLRAKVAEGADLGAVVDGQGVGLLTAAALCADKDKAVECVAVLLESDSVAAVVNKPAPGGFTPLMYAALAASSQCVSELLHHDADVGVVAEGGTTTLLAACGGQAGEDEERVAIVSELVTAGSQPMEADALGNTGLHEVCRRSNGGEGIVQILLTLHLQNDSGEGKGLASAEQLNKSSESPAYLAYINVNRGIVKLLTDLGVDFSSFKKKARRAKSMKVVRKGNVL